jgi:hypothetical protein
MRVYSCCCSHRLLGGSGREGCPAVLRYGVYRVDDDNDNDGEGEQRGKGLPCRGQQTHLANAGVGLVYVAEGLSKTDCPECMHARGIYFCRGCKMGE